MKKYYNQPIVETTLLIAGGQALCTTSPASVINVGEGGSTSEIPVPGIDPVPGD